MTARAALLLYVLCAALLAAGGGLFGGGLLGIAAVEWLAIGAPALLAVGARWGRPAARHIVGGALVGLSAWVPITAVIYPLQERLAPTPPELLRALEDVTTSPDPLPLVLFAIALTPAICEELLCRGVLLSAFEKPLGRFAAVAASAALFGVLHLSPYRFLPTFLLGLGFGVLAIQARSVIPAMVAHALNNSVVVILSRPEAAALHGTLDAHAGVVVGGGVVLLTIGIALAVKKR